MHLLVVLFSDHHSHLTLYAIDLQAVDDRKKTLLTEYKERKKTNVFIDKRYQPFHLTLEIFLNLHIQILGFFSIVQIW